jgi:hypothetical protein
MKKNKITLTELKVSSFISETSTIKGGIEAICHEQIKSPLCMYSDTGNCIEP